MRISVFLVAFVALVVVASAQRTRLNGGDLPPRPIRRRLRSSQVDNINNRNSEAFSALAQLSEAQSRSFPRREYLAREAVPYPLPLEPKPQPLPSKQHFQDRSVEREQQRPDVDLIPYRPRPESPPQIVDIPFPNRNTKQAPVELKKRGKFQVTPPQIPILTSRRRQRPAVFKENETIYRKRPEQVSAAEVPVEGQDIVSVYPGDGPIVVRDAPNLTRNQQLAPHNRRPAHTRHVKRPQPTIPELNVVQEPKFPKTSLTESSADDYIENPEEFDFPRKESGPLETKEQNLDEVFKQSQEEPVSLPFSPQKHQLLQRPKFGSNNPEPSKRVRQSSQYEDQSIRLANPYEEQRIRQRRPNEGQRIRQRRPSGEERPRQRVPYEDQSVRQGSTSEHVNLRQANPPEENSFWQQNPFREEIRKVNTLEEHPTRQNTQYAKQNLRQRSPSKFPKRKKVTPKSVLKQSKDFKKDKRAVYGGGSHLDKNGINFADNLKHIEGRGPKQDRISFQMHGLKGPHSYRFGFDTGKGHNRQFRYEERDNHGEVKGRYGYYDNHGKLQIVNYSAHPKLGFKADVPKY